VLRLGHQENKTVVRETFTDCTDNESQNSEV
jgi:hypothetical protein